MVSGGDSLRLHVLLAWPDPLSDFVEKRLQRGLPVTVGIRLELWQNRSAWFDRRLLTVTREFQVSRDPWDNSYVTDDGEVLERADSLAQLEGLLERQQSTFALDRSWVDSGARFQVTGVAFVRPLSARDVREVEVWLNGELGESPGGILGLPRGLFALARDLAGLGEQSSHVESRSFRLTVVPSGRLRVVIPGN